MVYSNGVSTLFMDMWGGEILTIPEIHIQTTLPPPPILSDSGRALSAYGVSRIVTPVGPTEYAWITPLRHVRPRVPLLPVTSRRCSRQREKRVLLTLYFYEFNNELNAETHVQVVECDQI